MGKMKECERCPKLFKCNDKLVCGNSSSDNYDRFIEAIDECDVYGPDAIEELPFTYTEVHMDSSEIDSINHPGHYETGKFECIDVMLETQGTEAVRSVKTLKSVRRSRTRPSGACISPRMLSRGICSLEKRQRLEVLRLTVNQFPCGKHWRFNSSLLHFHSAVQQAHVDAVNNLSVSREKTCR